MATEDVYATLLLNDLYLPGALVLAHSLRDAATTKKLAVLVTTDSVSTNALAELQRVYDYVIPVERIVNQQPQNLSLMDRVDLHSTFTKITLWKQTQFRRMVYMDSDMVVWRAPDELFDIEAPFSAAPDIGWPDMFNSGLMVLKPNMGDYWALHAMAQRGISFDGADQGLLNMHFKNTYNRLSFSYNVTPSAHYQYIPAYRHFQSSISATHFIGKEKPWTQGREASNGPGPYNEITGRWWAVYDRHYRGEPHPIVQHYVKGEFQPQTYTSPSISTTAADSEIPDPFTVEPSFSETNDIAADIEVKVEPIPEPAPFVPDPAPFVPESAPFVPDPAPFVQKPAPFVEQPALSFPEPAKAQDFVAPFSTWDPSRSAPPAHSKPEAVNFPATQYIMSSDPTPYKAPERYPDPPKDMYYEVPKTPAYQKPAPIFPWEKDAPKPTRVFVEDEIEQTTSESAPTEEEFEPATPTTPSAPFIPTDPWQSFSKVTRNAWDDIPEIERYIGALQKNRKGNIQVLQGYGTGVEPVPGPGGRRASTRVTDFPTEFERPSLPVTPAPIRRPSFWDNERDEDGELPVAEGVPAQADWDPVAQLEALARRQSEVLGKSLGEGAKEIPQRPLPFGSEGLKITSPTTRSPKDTSPPGSATDLKGEAKQPVEEGGIKKPSYSGPSVAWEKDEGYLTRETPLGPDEEEQDALAE